MPNEYTLSLSSSTYLFIGKKPTAVLFGNERVPVKTWVEVYTTILTRCNQDSLHHENLMYLRDKVIGKCRVFLSQNPGGMIRPKMIDEEMYGETHYGAATLFHILRDRILAPARFNYSNICIAIKH